MKITDWITVVLSAISIIISIFTWIKTNKKTNAQIEIEIKKMIDEKKQAFINNITDEKVIANYLIEEELNAYDKACALYNDNKVDKERFKKDYYNEIANIFENENFVTVGKLNEKSCKYNNLIDIYDKGKIQEEGRICLMKF